jgi:glycosyltransferase involved in cell wall biosynthesis
VKVADLIRDSIWLPNPGRASSKRPGVSILMPTYARGVDGSFGRSVRSVLDQSLADLELIVIDDGSVDGTDDLIRRFMADDPRVHCIRHPSNIGLPAISVFEGYQRARADYIGFAFDDDVFTRDGLARLFEFATAERAMFVHGYGDYGTPWSAPRLITLGRRDQGGHFQVPPEWVPPPRHWGNNARCLWLLEAMNFIGNMSVLVHRRVIETVGLYDPHVIMLRLCDWDLWRRVAARMPIDYCDVRVSVENANVRPDALGQTVDIDNDQIADYCALPRDRRLTPARFPDFDVVETPAQAAPRLAAYAEQCLRALQAQGRMRRIPPAPASKRVLFLYDQGPATHLLFRPLPPDDRLQFHVHHGHTVPDSLWPNLINASAVVVCRRVSDFASLGITADLRELEIPIYFYPADHPIPPDLRETFPDLKGLVLPTQAAAERASALGLQAALFHWPLGCREDELEDAMHNPPIADGLSVGFVGGETARDEACERLSAIRAAGAPPIRIHAHPGGTTPVGEGVLGAVPVAEEIGWTQLVERWRRSSVHVLIVGPGYAPETVFDGHAAILLSCLIGAIPVILDPEALPGIGEMAGVVRAGQSEGSLETILRELADGSRHATLYDRLRRHCAVAYAHTHAEESARRFLAAVPPTDVLAAESRWRRLERLRTTTIVSQQRALEQCESKCRALEPALAHALERVRALEAIPALPPPPAPTTVTLARTLVRRVIGALRRRVSLTMK